MSIIDTPAEGFPLPTVDPGNRRTMRDVLSALSPGARAIIRRRAEESAALAPALLAQEMHTDEEWTAKRDGADIPPRTLADILEEAEIPTTFPAKASPIRFAPEEFIAKFRAAAAQPFTVNPLPVEVTPGGDALAESIRPIAPDIADLIEKRREETRRGDYWKAEADRRSTMTDGIVESLSRRYAADVEAKVAAAFAGGRAYERGATTRRGVGAKSLGSRRVQALGIAGDYLRDDPQDGARLAALVLAGFYGQPPESVR